jgi:transposase
MGRTAPGLKVRLAASAINREPAAMPSETTVHVAIELSLSSWLVAIRLPHAEKSRVRRIEGGDTTGLLALLADVRRQASTKLGAGVNVACCFEAGRDGFWLHRLLAAQGFASYVLEPTSILVNRRARRAKTDRLDAEGMLRVLAAWLSGDRQVCSVVQVPTPEDEDAKRPHREREHLVQEKLRIENRIEALLFTQGIRGRPSLRSWDRDMADLRTGDGRPLPSLLRAELDRLRRRLVLALELIRELEAERAAALTAATEAVAADSAMARKITALQRIRGIGENFSAVLVREVLYRSFANRRQLASYVGIAPMPYQSGGLDRDRSISRAGNPRARTTLIQLAWLWLRYQPGSALAGWFRERVGALQGRTRRIAIVAMARKLLIALWRYVETGVLPEGIEIRADAGGAA